MESFSPKNYEKYIKKQIWYGLSFLKHLVLEMMSLASMLTPGSPIHILCCFLAPFKLNSLLCLTVPCDHLPMSVACASGELLWGVGGPKKNGRLGWPGLERDYASTSPSAPEKVEDVRPWWGSRVKHPSCMSISYLVETGDSVIRKGPLCKV